VSSRREQKERLRQERLARERATRKASSRRRTIQIGVTAGALIALASVIAVFAVASSDSGSNGATEAGVMATRAPWQPEYGSLQKRVTAMGLPQAADYPFHIHSMLRVYVSGERVPVPSQIGIDPSGQFIASLHTHDASGVVHMEAVEAYPFKLGEFFNVWGVEFTDHQIGAYQNGGGRTVQVYVNGKRIADPVGYVMKTHDRIVVGYGKPGSFPQRFSTPFPNGL
jgi:hypothetical protein